MNDLIAKHRLECSSAFRKEVDDSFAKFYDKLDSCDREKTRWITDLEKEVAVFTNVTKTMQKDITEIKTALRDFIESADTKYAKKTTTDFMTKVLWTFWIAIIFWMWSFIWGLLTNSILWK